MNKGQIFQIQNYSVNDGEGIRTTVFFAGCPLRCVWCANPEGLCEGKKTDIKEIVDKIKSQMIFYRKSGGGVTFSGGEATIQTEFLDEISTRFYDMGIDLAIETCGYFDFEKVRTIFERMDMIFFDIKHMDEESHKKQTGVSNKLILENAKKIYSIGKPMVIRMPFIVGFNNSKENLDKLADFISINMPNVKLEILPYHKLGEDKYRELGFKLPPKTMRVPTEEELHSCKTYLMKKGLKLVSYS